MPGLNIYLHEIIAPCGKNLKYVVNLPMLLQTLILLHSNGLLDRKPVRDHETTEQSARDSVT